MQPETRDAVRTKYAPIYIATFGASLMAMISIPTVTGLNLFSILAILLLCIGFEVSWLEKVGVVSRKVRLLSVAVVVVGSVAVVMSTMGTSPFVSSLYQVGTNDPIWACVLAWIIGVLSFNSKSPRRLLFLCVPGLSTIGVVATVDPTAGVAACFIAFLGFACFVLIQENTMDEQSSPTHGVFIRAERREPLRWHINLSTGLVLASVVMGMILGATLLGIVERYGGRPFSPVSGGAFSGGFMGQRFQEVATGSTTPSEQEVMTVSCPEPLLWRGQTYDHYNGRGWEISDDYSGEGAKIIPYEVAMRSALSIWQGKIQAYRLPANLLSENVNSIRSIRQIFEVKKLRFFVLFSAAEPRVFQCDRKMDVYVNDGRVTTRRSYGADLPYRVISDVSSATPEQLRSAMRTYSDRIKERYLSPVETTPEVKGLVRKLTSHLNNNYDKAMAIEDYLVANCVYDLNAPATPPDKDAVDYFLFTSKKGYCDIFSTAMAVMCREAKIPSRWATGFASGEYNRSDQKFHVRMKDQHAWVELYFPKYGWITFDPTAGSTEPSMAARLRRAAKYVKTHILGAGAMVPVGILAFALVVYIFKTEVWERVQIRRRKSAKRKPAPWARHAEIYGRMCSLLRKFGLERHEALTPSEFAEDLMRSFSPELEHITEKISTITAGFEEARYSPHEVSEERLKSSQEILSTLREDLRTARRDKLLPSYNRK